METDPLRALFQNRTIAIATFHGKEKAIAPILEKKLGLRCVVPPHLNTDAFGTFTGEISRLHDPTETARLKCKTAMAVTGLDLSISSEGSFGPHPSLFFVPSDTEELLLMDSKHNLEFTARIISSETNYSATEFCSVNELMEFAKVAKFPSHALILRKDPGSQEYIYKGIKSLGVLEGKAQELLNRFGRAYVETDMRAMNNPSRMKVIKKTTLHLVEKIKSLCPNCSFPGYSAKQRIAGLPCDHCGLPTKSTLKSIYECLSCHHTEERNPSKSKATEDPMYCDYCNP